MSKYLIFYWLSMIQEFDDYMCEGVRGSAELGPCVRGMLCKTDLILCIF